MLLENEFVALCFINPLSSIAISIQVTKMIHFCFSVTQDCLQLIADSDMPTIRKGNKIVPVIFPPRIQYIPITYKFQVQRPYSELSSNLLSTSKL